MNLLKNGRSVNLKIKVDEVNSIHLGHEKKLITNASKN